MLILSSSLAFGVHCVLGSSASVSYIRHSKDGRDILEPCSCLSKGDVVWQRLCLNPHSLKEKVLVCHTNTDTDIVPEPNSIHVQSGPGLMCSFFHMRRWQTMPSRRRQDCACHFSSPFIPAMKILILRKELLHVVQVLVVSKDLAMVFTVDETELKK